MSSTTEKNSKDDFPRRQKLWLMKPSEIKIREAMGEIEKMGCDVMLTSAINYLQQALNLVGDFIDQNE